MPGVPSTAGRNPPGPHAARLARGRREGGRCRCTDVGCGLGSERGGLGDRGSVTAPTFAIYSTEGEWIIEGHGVEPDIDTIKRAIRKAA